MDPVLDPVLEPVLEPVLAPVLDPVLEPVLAPALAPVLGPVLDPILDPVLEPVLEPVLDPVLEPVLERSWAFLFDNLRLFWDHYWIILGSFFPQHLCFGSPFLRPCECHSRIVGKWLSPTASATGMGGLSPSSII